MVMLHIKLNGSQMQQHGSIYLLTDRPLPRDPEEGTKIQLFQNMAMLHIKLKGITNAATWYQICCPYRPCMSKGQN